MDKSRHNQCGCSEYGRVDLHRAEAGAGLPQVEPGMPIPAGSGLSRRSLLLRAAGLAVTVYGADALMPEAFQRAVADAVAAPADDRVLVSVFLSGGADSLTILAPTTDPIYQRFRPTLAVSPDQGTPFTEDDRLRWSPDAAGLAELHAEGKLTVIPAIGYEDPNQSHFTSEHFWQVGEISTASGSGWLGRYLDLNGTDDNPLQGLTLDSLLMPSLASSSAPVAVLSSPSAINLTTPGVSNRIQESVIETLGTMAARSSDVTSLGRARDAVTQTIKLREQMTGIEATAPGPGYPYGRFGERLAALASMIATGLPLRCVSIMAPGSYDTHAGQAESLPDLLEETTQGLLAFQRDLEARGVDGRVLTHIWSEFGRRPEQNLQGTDHGAGGVSFLMGSPVAGAMIGEYPGLDQLDPDDNLRHNVDFRSIYCSLLEQWLEADAEAIIPGAAGFDRPTLLR